MKTVGCFSTNQVVFLQYKQIKKRKTSLTKSYEFNTVLASIISD